LYNREWKESKESINPQLLALKKEEENHQTSFGARPKIQGVPIQSIHSGHALEFGERPKQSAKQHTQHIPPST
jgi:hypothetical protein